MTTIKYWSYNKNKLLILKNKLDEQLTIYTVINTQDETISYNCKEIENNIICDDINYKKLDQSDIYTFKSIMDSLNNSKLDNNLMKDILNMNFVKDIYLPASAGSFTTPHKNKFIGYFFIFSTMFLPYQMIDFELVSKPQYIDDLKQSFFTSNNKIIYYFKEIIRYALILPGLIFTPFILATVILALRNMS